MGLVLVSGGVGDVYASTDIKGIYRVDVYTLVSIVDIWYSTIGVCMGPMIGGSSLDGIGGIRGI